MFYDFFDDRECIICHCTTMKACPGGCYWVDDNLCSQCSQKYGFFVGLVVIVKKFFQLFIR